MSVFSFFQNVENKLLITLVDSSLNYPFVSIFFFAYFNGDEKKSSTSVYRVYFSDSRKR